MLSSFEMRLLSKSLINIDLINFFEYSYHLLTNRSLSMIENCWIRQVEIVFEGRSFTIVSSYGALKTNHFIGVVQMEVISGVRSFLGHWVLSLYGRDRRNNTLDISSDHNRVLFVWYGVHHETLKGYRNFAAVRMYVALTSALIYDMDVSHAVWRLLYSW